MAMAPGLDLYRGGLLDARDVQVQKRLKILGGESGPIFSSSEACPFFFAMLSGAGS